MKRNCGGRSPSLRGCRRSAATHLVEALEPRTLLHAPFIPQLPLGSYIPTAFPQGISADQLREGYRIDGIQFGGITGNGAGQTIAIIDSYDDPYALSDLKTFDKDFGLPNPPRFRKMNENGGTSLPPAPALKREHHGTFEESIDVQWAHAVAPAASIVLIETDSPSVGDEIAHGVRTAARLPGVVAVSLSVGYSPFIKQVNYDHYFTTPPGHKGVTFLASSGDFGANSGSTFYPASSPNVVAVGGTVLGVDSAGNFLGESGWNGSGGGISSVESQPSYQTGIVTQSTTGRAIPDVSFDAVGFPICDTYDNGRTTPWETADGTSVSCPAWAGLIAIADQGRAAVGLDSLDGATQTLPDLYHLPQRDFRDIQNGNNGFAAGPGYDLVTGLGSPVADVLVPDLAFGTGPFVVTNSNDSGNGSLRQAIEEVDHSATPAIISFNISPKSPDNKNGVITIRPVRELPLITRGHVTIDASTQPSAAIILDAKRSKRLGRELFVGASDIIVRDLEISI